MKTKKNHMPWAADLCFLYLHVSQNAALYRNTEKKLQQASSRTKGFVFWVWIKVGQTQLENMKYTSLGVLLLYFFVVKHTINLPLKTHDYNTLTSENLGEDLRRSSQGELCLATLSDHQSQEQLIKTFSSLQRSSQSGSMDGLQLPKTSES